MSVAAKDSLIRDILVLPAKVTDLRVKSAINAKEADADINAITARALVSRNALTATEQGRENNSCSQMQRLAVQ